jgi:AraC-like DNA-binding protein
MQYRKINHAHSSFLLKHIAFIYEMVSDGEEVYYKTIPNALIGYSVLLSGSGHYLKENQWEVIPTSSLYGLVKKPTVMRLGAFSRDISIGFNPVLMSQFVNRPMHLVSDGFTDARDIFLNSNIDKLEDELHLARTDVAIISAIEQFLRSCYSKRYDLQLLEAYKNIAELKYNKVDQMSKDLNFSSRTIQTKFNAEIGMTPKDLIKVLRVKNALDINMNDFENLTALTYQLGYFDQSHFIKEFRDILDITPEKYFKNKALISDFYNYERWSLT